MYPTKEIPTTVKGTTTVTTTDKQVNIIITIRPHIFLYILELLVMDVALFFFQGFKQISYDRYP